MISGEIMKRTSNPSSRSKQPVVVSIPAAKQKDPFTLEEAEAILKRHGARPATAKEIEIARKFDNPDY
jgi:hypothetical protein